MKTAQALAISDASNGKRRSFNKLHGAGISADSIATGAAALSKRFDAMTKSASDINRQLDIIRGGIALVAADQQIDLEKLP